MVIPYHFIITIVGVFCGALIINPGSILEPHFWLAVIIAGPLIGSAFNAFNAISDLEIDKITKPLRPLPAKQVRVIDALALTIACYAFALLGAYFFFSQSFLILVIVDVVITFLYSFPLLKLKNIFMVNDFAVAIHYGYIPLLLGMLSVSGALPESWLIKLVPILLLAFSVILIKDFEDYESEGQLGVRNLLTVYGPRKASKIVFACIFSSFVIWGAFFLIGLFNQGMWFVWLALLAYSLAVAYKLVRNPTPFSATKILILGTLLGLLSEIALVLVW